MVSLQVASKLNQALYILSYCMINVMYHFAITEYRLIILIYNVFNSMARSHQLFSYQ